MAKTLVEQLSELLDPETQAKVRAAIAAKPELVRLDQKGAELYSVYAGLEDTPPVHVPAVPSAATTTSGAAPVTTTPSPAGYDAIMAELTKLNTSIDTRLEAKLKDYIPAAKLPGYRIEILGDAIKAADDYAMVREDHRAEFNEPLDRAAYAKFVEDNAANKINFPSLKAAHDVFVADKRKVANEAKEKAKIDAAVAEALKTARSAGTVPGQTQTTALSPAAQVIAKAKAAAATSGDGDTPAMRAARQLEAIERANSDRLNSVQ